MAHLPRLEVAQAQRPYFPLAMEAMDLGQRLHNQRRARQQRQGLRKIATKSRLESDSDTASNYNTGVDEARKNS